MFLYAAALRRWQEPAIVHVSFEQHLLVDHLLTCIVVMKVAYIYG